MKLQRINNVLLAGIIAVNLYTIAGPLLPGLNYWWQDRGGQKQAQLQKKLTATPAAAAETQPNAVTIPSMLLD